MGKRNGKNGRQLARKSPGVAVANVSRAQGGYRPGAGRPTDTFRMRAQHQLERAMGLEVLGSILSGDILELIGVQKTGEPIVGFTRNADRISAFRELAQAAGHAAPRPISIETTGDVVVQVVYDE